MTAGNPMMITATTSGQRPQGAGRTVAATENDNKGGERRCPVPTFTSMRCSATFVRRVLEEIMLAG